MPRRKAKPAGEAEAPGLPACVHHYQVAAQSGAALLRGTCKKCGAERLFRADAGMEDELALMRQWGFGDFAKRRRQGRGKAS